jgi:hypothetical protein
VEIRIPVTPLKFTSELILSVTIFAIPTAIPTRLSLLLRFPHLFHHYCDSYTTSTITAIPTRLPLLLRFLHAFHYYYNSYTPHTATANPTLPLLLRILLMLAVEFLHVFPGSAEIHQSRIDLKYRYLISISIF